MSLTLQSGVDSWLLELILKLLSDNNYSIDLYQNSLNLIPKDTSFWNNIVNGSVIFLGSISVFFADNSPTAADVLFNNNLIDSIMSAVTINNEIVSPDFMVDGVSRIDAISNIFSNIPDGRLPVEMEIPAICEEIRETIWKFSEDGQTPNGTIENIKTLITELIIRLDFNLINTN